MAGRERHKFLVILSIFYTLPAATITQSIPACFQNAASKSSISCIDENLQQIDSTVYSQISPAITPTTISSVELVNCTITNLDFLDSSFLQDVNYVYLSNLKGLANHHLSSLVPYISLSATRLTIKDHPTLTSVDDIIPANTNNGEWARLKELNVKNNALTSVSRDLFAKIKSPAEYDFSINSLATLDLTAHKAVLQVKKLSLDNNRLTSVPGLGDFSALEELDLSTNLLTDVGDFVTQVIGGGKLSLFDLSNNLIQSFSPAGTTSLDENSNLLVDLRNNQLLSISDLGSGVVKNVHKLYLSGNTNLKIQSTTFTGLNNLMELRLSTCGVTQITTHLQNLPGLHILHLDDNLIGSLGADTFKGTNQLIEVSVKNNNLEKLEFMSSQTTALHELLKLDASLNQLITLDNFVAAPRLRELRIDGKSNKNRFSQLSACDTFTTLPSTLKIVCARDILSSTEKSCRYQTFIDLFKADPQIIFNNKECCDNPTCDEVNALSSYPATQDCGTKEEACAIIPIIPGGGGTTAAPGGDNNLSQQCPARQPFQSLHNSEMVVIALGYILMFIFLAIAIILFSRRYRSYDKWLADHRKRDEELAAAAIPTQVRKSTDTLDSVDGRKAYSPRIAMNGTLQRPKFSTTKSIDTLSTASGISSMYGGAANKSPFAGRKKFKEANSIDLEEQSVRYTPQSQRKFGSDVSGDGSPTTMSVYSYASHQAGGRRPSENTSPPQQRRRHRSGGAVQRLKSHDLLDELLRCDSDLVPPQVQVVLQRKASEKRKSTGASSLARNTRAYNTAPYRSKGKAGVVKKTSRSPMLTVNRIHRAPRGSSSSMNNRALPDIPPNSVGSANSGSALLSAASSFLSNQSKLSSPTFLKAENVEEQDYDETHHLRIEEESDISTY